MKILKMSSVFLPSFWRWPIFLLRHKGAGGQAYHSGRAEPRRLGSAFKAAETDGICGAGSWKGASCWGRGSSLYEGSLWVICQGQNCICTVRDSVSPSRKQVWPGAEERYQMLHSCLKLWSVGPVREGLGPHHRCSVIIVQMNDSSGIEISGVFSTRL